MSGLNFAGPWAGALLKYGRRLVRVALIVCGVGLLLQIQSASAQVLVSFPGGSDSPSAIAPGLASSTLMPGPDLNSVNFADNDGQMGLVISAANWTTDPTPDPDSSFSFTLTPSAGKALLLTEVSFDLRSQGSGPQRLAVYYAVDLQTRTPFGGAFEIEEFDTWKTFTAEGSVSVPEGSSITLYIFGFNAAAPDKKLSLDSIETEGEVISVPEPGSGVLIGVGLLIGVLASRKGGRVFQPAVVTRSDS